MPVKSLTSSVLRWPDRATVDGAVRRWADEAVRRRCDVWRIGYFGSYARGDWGVGSDVDLVIVVASTNLPFERRALEWDTAGLPVPADLLVYSRAEWESMAGKSRFHRTVTREAVWDYQSEAA